MEELSDTNQQPTAHELEFYPNLTQLRPWPPARDCDTSNFNWMQGRELVQYWKAIDLKAAHPTPQWLEEALARSWGDRK